MGMNHVEQEIAAAQLWNYHIDNDIDPGQWIDIEPHIDMYHLFNEDRSTGKSLENTGFLEIDRENGKMRFCVKATWLLMQEAQKQAAKTDNT